MAYLFVATPVNRVAPDDVPDSRGTDPSGLSIFGNRRGPRKGPGLHKLGNGSPRSAVFNPDKPRGARCEWKPRCANSFSRTEARHDSANPCIPSRARSDRLGD